MQGELDEKLEIANCLSDVLSAVSYTTRLARSCRPTIVSAMCTPEVLFYEYDKATKERRVEEETADTWDGPCETELNCETCGESHNDIIERGPSDAGWRLDSLSVFCPDISEDQLITGGRPKECYASVMCQSCLVEKECPEEVEDGFGERCSACGITNLLCCDEDVVEDYFHYNTYRDLGLCGFCPSCSDNLSEQDKAEKLYDRRERLSIHPYAERGGDRVRVIETLEDSDDDLDLTDGSDEEDIYGNSQEWGEEYENEELPENNSEKARKIKETIREVGEKMFDLQEILKEGDYLVIMDLLQKVTNEVNSL
jgi:hypothetical protein